MFRALKARAPLALAVAGAISVAMAGTSGNVAQASGGGGPDWGTSTAPGGLGEAIFAGAACAGGGPCLATGEAVAGSGGAPIVAAETGGSWGTPSTAAISGVSSPDGAYFSISCVSASLCVGVGYNESGSAYVPIAGPILVTGTSATAISAGTLSLPSSPAAASPEVSGLLSVSCTAGGCTAVGYYKTTGAIEEPIEATGNGSGSWTVATVVPPAAATGGADLNTVSCPSGGACEAAGSYVDGSGHLQNWAVQLGGGTSQTITMPSAAVAATGSLPATPSELSFDNPASINGLSCPSAGVCTAGGQYPTAGGGSAPMAVSISNGTPAPAVGLTAPAGLSVTSINALSCSDAGDCIADGNEITPAGSSETFVPVTAYESAGTWSALTELPGVTATESLAIGLACSASDTCLATGLAVNAGASSIVPMVAFSAPPLSVSTASLPAAVAGVPYSTTLQGAGGAGTSNWTINGTLPAGLSLNASTGIISGTPTVPGSNSFTAQIASAGPPTQTATANLSITVAAVPKLSAGATRGTAAGLRLALGCSGSGTCAGTAVVTAVEHLTGKKPTAVTARKKKTLKLTLARASYSLTAGQLGSVTLNLTSKAKALLKKLHKLSGELTLTPTGASKPSITRTVTFKSAVKKRKKK